jgi:hypothetical protein
MHKCGARAIRLWLLGLGLGAAFCGVGSSLSHVATSVEQTGQGAGSDSVSRHIGGIKSIKGNALTLTPDSGVDLNVMLLPSTRIVRVAPGEKDLKNATPIQLQDLQVGDRVLVAGKSGDDSQSLIASTVVVMTRSDLAARHQQDLQDWQKRGVDGPATAVDTTAGTITITVRGKSVLVRTSSRTVIRRYAPDSVRFDDAKPGTLAEIHPQDQVRARGERNADGSELAAEEIVSGSFRNIAGTVTSSDAGSATVSIQDLLSRKTVTVKITQDSQLHQLPQEIAQRFAVRLKRTAAGAVPGVAPASDTAAGGHSARSGAEGMASGEEGTFRHSGGSPDLQQMLNHLPALALTDLHKGDAVVVLSTAGSMGVGTAIILLTGVEPILQAAPNAIGASILTPWSLSAPSGDAGGP